MKRLGIGWALVALALGACGEQEEVDLGGDFAIVVSVPPLERRAIDLLFVVDDSGSISDDAEAIAAKAKEALFDVIASSLGGPPDLHVGVISSGMVIATPGVDGCNADDDVGNGRLTTTPRRPECLAPTGNFLIDVAADGGGRTTNFAGTLEEAFSCLVPLGTEGCGLEQPLAAAKRAVSGTVPENVGFLRPEALLVVVFISDEDDCSAIDEGVFDPADGPLGPLTSYRCFQHMIECEQSLDAAGGKSGCHPWAASPYALPLAEAADALIAAKGGDASLVFVATIAGDTSPVSVSMNVEGRLQLDESCTSTVTTAAPAIRLHGFLDAFPARSWSESLCTDDYAPTLRRTAEYVGDVAARRGCLRGSVIDYDSGAAGIQPRCRVYASTAVTREAGESRDLPSCESDDGDGACARIVTDGATCVHTGLGLRVEVDPRGEDLGGRHIIAECKTR